ncbi:MAG: M23 family metallopeptidase, partial [Holophagales bacterium]|nr:M23 family metallopeptidase [Holophagales bacterium]
MSSLSRAAIFCIIGIVGTNCFASNDSPSKAPKAASESAFISWLKKHTSKDASMADNPFRSELDSLPMLHGLGSIEIFPMLGIPVEPVIPVRPFAADDGLDYRQDFPQPLDQPFPSSLKAPQNQDPSAEGDPPFPPDSMGDAPFAPDLDSLDLMWPVETRTISSGWGPRRRTAIVVVKTPAGNRRISKPYTGTHKGVDLTAPHGFSIFAAMEGRVCAVGRDRAIGNYVAIDHGEGIETFYGHNKANLVAVGDTVRRGQIIATVGSTGRSTGPHVHFEV